MTSIIEKPFIQKVKVKKKSTKLKTIVTARLASYQQLFTIFFFYKLLRVCEKFWHTLKVH